MSVRFVLELSFRHSFSGPLAHLVAFDTSVRYSADRDADDVACARVSKGTRGNNNNCSVQTLNIRKRIR